MHWTFGGIVGIEVEVDVGMVIPSLWPCLLGMEAAISFVRIRA